MLGEQQPVAVEAGVDMLKFLDQLLFLKQFLAKPHRHRLQVGGKAVRRVAEIGLEQPFEFEKWLVVEHNIIEVP